MTYILTGLVIVTVLHIYYRIGCVHQTAHKAYHSKHLTEHRQALEGHSVRLVALEKNIVVLAETANEAYRKSHLIEWDSEGTAHFPGNVIARIKSNPGLKSTVEFEAAQSERRRKKLASDNIRWLAGKTNTNDNGGDE